MMKYLFFLAGIALLVSRPNADITSARITNAHVGRIVQDEGGKCFAEMILTGTAEFKWVWFDSTTPEGTYFLSEVLLARSKSFTNLTVRYTAVTGGPIPGVGDTAMVAMGAFAK